MVTYADAKAYLQLENDDDQTLVESLITQVEAEIEAFIELPLDQKAITGEVLQYPRGVDYTNESEVPLARVQKPYKLFTKYSPISLVTFYSGGSAVNTDRYNVDLETGTITILKWITDYDENLTVDYTAGFNPTSNEYQAIKNIVLQGVKSEFEQSGVTKKGTANITSKKIGSFSVSYSDSTRTFVEGNGLLPTYIAKNLSILNKYKDNDIF